MSSDIIINKPYPGVEYDATEASSVYHEDREYADATVGSRMYRTYNAQLAGNPPLWSCVNEDDDAYATVQYPDGSVHFLSRTQDPSEPWATEDWQGSGNNTVFNAVDYGMSPANTGSQNQVALLAAITAAAIPSVLIWKGACPGVLVEVS